jgi:hypothetical protein
MSYSMQKAVNHLCALWLGCASVIAIAADAESGLEALIPAVAKAGIVITTEPLRGNTADIEINGKRVASIGVDQVYKGLFDPGKIVINVKGGKAEIEAQPNKEYVFEIAMLPSTTGFMLFGLVGSSAMANYSIVLKDTRDLK